MADDLALVRSLEQLGDRVADERFARDLYRALAERRWIHPEDGLSVAASWKRAEEIVNLLRSRVGEEDDLTLAQTGGEGEVNARFGEEIERLGWRTEPLDTSEN